MSEGGNTNGQSTMVHTIHNRIKSDINEKLLLPGEKIKIKQLCSRYGVSETPIKQALMLLTFEGLVENIPKKGMRIKAVNWDEIEEVYSIRLMMETFFTDDIIATVKYNSSMREALEENVRKILEFAENATELDSHQKMHQLDRDFHELYLKCSGNKKMVEIYCNLNTHAYANYIFGSHPKERATAVVDEHRQILDAIIAQDRQALEEAIRLHMNNSKAIVKLLLKIDSISRNLH